MLLVLIVLILLLVVLVLLGQQLALVKVGIGIVLLVVWVLSCRQVMVESLVVVVVSRCNGGQVMRMHRGCHRVECVVHVVRVWIDHLCMGEVMMVAVGGRVAVEVASD